MRQAAPQQAGASVYGTVSDQSGAVIVGVQVGLHHQASGRLRTAVFGPVRAIPVRRHRAGLVHGGSAAELDVWIPGVGVMFNITPETGVFGGVHKGFAPPGPGSTEETKAESSVNYEFGFRAQSGALHAQAVGFFNDYRNLLGRDTLSSGGSGSGLLFNGGKARIYGIETSFSYDLRQSFEASLSVPVHFAYTLTQGHFRSNFVSSFEPWGTVSSGDELPYLARYQVLASIGLGRSNWNIDLDGATSAPCGFALDRGLFHVSIPRTRVWC